MRQFIFSHKDLPPNFPYNDYEIIRNDECTELDHHIWSELAGFKILYNRIVNEKDENGLLLWNENDYISLNHYRRLMDRNYFNKTCVPTQFMLETSLYEAYNTYHNIDDLKLCIQVLIEEFPHLEQIANQVLNDNKFIPYNMGIMTVSQFKDYAKFLFKILYNLNKKIGTNTYEERLEYIKNNPDKYTGEAKDNKIEYQARIEGYCAERMSTIYWFYMAKQIPILSVPVYLMEEQQTI